MTRRQRVYDAIGHREADRVPKGEIDIAPQLVATLLGKPKGAYLPEGVPFEDAVQVRKLLRMDLACVVLNTPASVNVGVDDRGRELVRDYLGNVRVCDGTGMLAACIRDPAITDSKGISSYEFPCVDGVSGASIRAWSEKTDFFVFALISGVFETARYLCGLENFCIWSRTCTGSLQDLLQKAAVFQSELAREAIAAWRIGQNNGHLIFVGSQAALPGGAQPQNARANSRSGAGRESARLRRGCRHSSPRSP